MLYYDNTRVSDYKACPRYFYFRHVRHLVPERVALPLIFGLAWHDAMDVVWPMAQTSASNDAIVKEAMIAFIQTWQEEGMKFPLELHEAEQLLPRTPSVAAEMLYGYLAARREFIESVEILAVERPFAVPLYESTEPHIPIYIGRLDKVIRHRTYGVLVIEHKTTTDYAKESGFKSNWVEQWSPNSQVDGYSHAAHIIYGEEMKGVWIDGALVHKTVHDKFKFVPVSRSTASLDEWLHETRDWIERLNRDSNFLWHYRNSPNIAYMGYPKHTGNCSSWAGCIYRDICKFNPAPDRMQADRFPGYIVKKWEPFDILKIEKLGLPPEVVE